jgi:hypothetical protein
MTLFKYFIYFGDSCDLRLQASFLCEIICKSKIAVERKTRFASAYFWFVILDRAF